MKHKKTVTFTGTREGLSPEQRLFLDRILSDHKPTLVRHGGCIGGDEEFHAISSLQVPRPSIHVFWGHLPKYRSQILSKPFVPYPPDDCVTRTKTMITLASQDPMGLVIACPKQKTEQLRSGTWTGIRFSRLTQGVKLYIIYPDASWDTHGAFLDEL